MITLLITCDKPFRAKTVCQPLILYTHNILINTYITISLFLMIYVCIYIVCDEVVVLQYKYGLIIKGLYFENVTAHYSQI